VAELAHGLYESFLDEELRAILERHPELRSVFGKIDSDEEPSRYAAFVARVIESALRLETDSTARLRLCNEVIDRLAGSQASKFLQTRRLIAADKPVLLETTPPYYAVTGIPRPQTPLAEKQPLHGFSE